MGNNIIYREIGKDSMYRTWHASDKAMFLYTYSDGGSIVCSEKAYPIEKGVLCLVGAKKYHYTLPDIAEDYTRNKLFVEPKLMDKLISVLPDSDVKGLSSNSFIYAKIPLEEQDNIDRIYRKMQENQNLPTYSEWIQTGCVIELLTYLCRYSLETTAAPKGAVSRAIEYINQNISEDITIDSICSEIHISKYHFCRMFKNTIGTTVMDYILNTRIIMAKDMLKSENITISEISHRCGFSSLSYFSRVFREKTGTTANNFKRLR